MTPGQSAKPNENGIIEERAGRSYRSLGFSQDSSHPASCLSWDDAKAYAAWLSRKTRKTYRLLSEAEWEYAARAGSTTRYAFGDKEADLCSAGNGADLTAWKEFADLASQPKFKDWKLNTACEDGYIFTSPVGVFAANGFGLHDFAGNVWEWVEDCYHESYDGAPSDGSSWTVGGICSAPVVRGGCWIDMPGDLRPANRGRNGSGHRNVILGFRLARPLVP